MISNKNKLFLFFSFSVFIFPLSAQKKFWSLEATYTGDLVSNFTGGIKTGTTYLGMATLNAGVDFETAGLWKNGDAFIKLANTHGGEPSSTLVGDFQGVSNIEAGNLTWLYELWYKQAFGKFSITGGLQDLNINFATSDCGGIFTNSSFGIHSSLADNIPTPIFPLTALGLNAEWSPSDNWKIKAAIFDGTPDDFENNPYNVHWQLSKDQGFLTVTEIKYEESLIRNQTGCYKIGFYYHQHNDTIDAEQKNRGFYFVGDQHITDNFCLFSQIGISPKQLNKNNLYYSIGFKYENIFKNRPDDFLGFAVAHAGIHDSPAGSETAIECTYHLVLNENMYIRPDLQYIINPAGTETKLKNALVGMVRFGVEF